MDSNIVKYVDQKYQFNKSAFRSSLSESNFGKRLAVISLIGDNFKFLNNIKNINHSEDTNYFINLYSKPKLLESSVEKTEVFLIYSNTSIRHFNSERLLVDTYGIFLNFSSTVILQFERIIQREELLNFEKIVEFHTKIKGRNKSFNELLIIVLDWDPNRPQYRQKDYLFGRKNGQKYFDNEFKDTKLKEYFELFNCYLLPSDQSKYYQTNLDQLNEQMLFNVDEMKVLKNDETNEDIKSDDFISLFKDHIQSLNERHFDDGLGQIDLKLVALSEQITDNQCNEQVSSNPSVSSGNIYQEFSASKEGNESLNVRPSEQTTTDKSSGRKATSTNLEIINLEVREKNNFENSTNFRKDSFDKNLDNSKTKVNNEIQFKDSINYSIKNLMDKNISEIEGQKERLPGLPAKQANIKDEINLYCDQLIEDYKEISDKIHLQSNKTDSQLSFILYNLRSDIIKKLNSKFINADQVILNEEKKKFQDKIILMESQFKEQFNNSKILFEKYVSDYKIFIENEIKRHFSSNDPHLIKIDLDAIHANCIQVIIEKSNQNETWLNELKSRINVVYNYYRLIADSLNNYVEEWMKLIRQSYVMNSDTEFEKLNKQFYEKSVINMNNMNDPILSCLTNQLFLEICSKVKHCLQQIISQKTIESELMFEEKLDVYDKMVKQIFENNFIAILSEDQFFEKQEMAVSKTILEQTAINSFIGSETLKTKMSKLESDLHRKRKQYLDFIMKTRFYIRDWNKQLKESKQIEPTLNEDIISQMKTTTDLLPDNSFFLNIFNQIFETFKAKSNDISMSEQRISSNIIKTITENFELWINHKLKTNFYEKPLFDSYSSKLIQYSVDSLRKNVNYLSQNREVLLNLDTILKEQLSFRKDSIYCEYEEKIKQVRAIINDKKEELITQIRKAISNEYPDNCFKNQSEFETNTKRIISKTFKSIEDFDSFFAQEFKQSLIDELKNSVEEDINSFLKTFNKLQQPEPKINSVQVSQVHMSHQNMRKTQNNNQELLSPFKTTVAKGGNKNPDPLTTIKPFATQKAPLYTTGNNMSLITLFGPTFLYSVFPKQNGQYFQVNDDNIDTRPNKILLTDKIYCGKNVVTNYNLDLLKLLKIRDLKDVDHRKKLLKKYSQNVTDNLTVKFSAINKELCIESMIALQVMDIKIDAEKDGVNKVNKALFIVPTHFTIKQLCDFKNVGKITGFNDSSVDVVTQISCAAIGFAEKIRRNRVNTTQNVLFIALNGYICDLAVCCLKDRQIEFKCFLTQNLNNCKQILNEHQFLAKIITNFKDALKTVEKDNNNFYSIQSVIFIGFSLVSPEIEEQIKNMFQYKYEKNIDHVNLILEGAAYFAQSNSTQENIYKIIDITKETLVAKFKFVSRIPWSSLKEEKLFVKNTKLPAEKFVQFNDKKFGDFPLTVKIYEGQFQVATYSIKCETEWKKFNLNFKFILNEKHNLSLKEKCVTNDRQEKTLFVEESLLDNSYIEHQREIFMRVPNSLWDRSIQTNNHLDAKNKLEHLCKEMRAKMEQVQLSVIIKASINDALKEALNLLKSNNCDRDSYEKNFKSLETLKNSFLKSELK